MKSLRNISTDELCSQARPDACALPLLSATLIAVINQTHRNVSQEVNDSLAPLTHLPAVEADSGTNITGLLLVQEFDFVGISLFLARKLS